MSTEDESFPDKTVILIVFHSKVHSKTCLIYCLNLSSGKLAFVGKYYHRIQLGT